MATKTVPAKSKRKSIETETEITILKKSSCPTLSQTGTIDYEITLDSNGTILIGLTGNSGAGFFSKARQPVTEVTNALEQFQAKHEITSLALKDLYPQVSINSWSFLMAALLAEKVIEPLVKNKRRYQLCNVDAFLRSLDKLRSQHSGSGKGKPKAKVKTAASMRKAKNTTKPATGK